MSRGKYILFLRQVGHTLFLRADRTGSLGDKERLKSERTECGVQRLLCGCRTPSRLTSASIAARVLSR